MVSDPDAQCHVAVMLPDQGAGGAGSEIENDIDTRVSHQVGDIKFD